MKSLSGGTGDAGRKSSNGGVKQRDKTLQVYFAINGFQKLSITSLNWGAQIIKRNIISGKCCEIYKDK